MVEHWVEHSISDWGLAEGAGPYWVLGAMADFYFYKSLKNNILPPPPPPPL